MKLVYKSMRALCKHINSTAKGVITVMFLCASIGMQMMFPIASNAQEARLEVIESTFAREVENMIPVNACNGRTSVAPLYLWIRVKGSQWALRKLVNMGKLPIYHLWFKYTIIGGEFQGITDSIELLAGEKELSEKLQMEITNRGFFDWRTWSMKENITRGKWIVRIVYSDSTPVLRQNGTKFEEEILVE